MISSIMKMEFMSSDESDKEDGTAVIVRRPLPWLSREATEVLASLDRRTAGECLRSHAR